MKKQHKDKLDMHVAKIFLAGFEYARFTKQDTINYADGYLSSIRNALLDDCSSQLYDFIVDDLKIDDILDLTKSEADKVDDCAHCIQEANLREIFKILNPELTTLDNYDCAEKMHYVISQIIKTELEAQNLCPKK